MNKTIVVFSPHPDDELLGCGGLIAKRKRQGYEVCVCIATTGDNKIRIDEEKKSCELLKVDYVEFLGLPDLHLSDVPKEELNAKVLSIIEKYKPEEVYTPHRFDLHFDHRTLTESVLVAVRPKYNFRPKSVFAYETISETGWNYSENNNHFNPNVYEDITKEIELKKEALALHNSQIFKYPSARSLEAIEALAIYRGTQAEMNYAEAFYLIRSYNNE